jgi:preprotein translocase subunit Sec63
MGKVLLLLAGIGILYLWWQSRSRRAPAMPLPDARRLLGLSEDASLEDIRAAHRRLIARVHPDAGGSAELAERVNAARDTLIAEMNRRTPRAS